MATAFAQVEGHRLSTDDVDTTRLGDALVDSLKPYGFRCGPPQVDSAAALSGVRVECEAVRRGNEIQKLRMRELWGTEGILVQAVTWTVGSKTAPEAEKFWTSLRLTTPGPSGNLPTVKVAAVPVDVVVAHTFAAQ